MLDHMLGPLAWLPASVLTAGQQLVGKCSWSFNSHLQRGLSQTSCECSLPSVSPQYYLFSLLP